GCTNTAAGATAGDDRRVHSPRYELGEETGAEEGGSALLLDERLVRPSLQRRLQLDPFRASDQPPRAGQLRAQRGRSLVQVRVICHDGEEDRDTGIPGLRQQCDGGLDDAAQVRAERTGRIGPRSGEVDDEQRGPFTKANSAREAPLSIEVTEPVVRQGVVQQVESNRPEKTSNRRGARRPAPRRSGTESGF